MEGEAHEEIWPGFDGACYSCAVNAFCNDPAKSNTRQCPSAKLLRNTGHGGCVDHSKVPARHRLS